MQRESGQALLIAVFIGLLLLVSVPVIVFVNIMGSRHRVSSTKRDKGTAIAEEGISYAKQFFSTLTAGAPTTWTNALAGTFAVPCNTTTDIVGADGSHFRLTCGSNANPAGSTLGCPVVPGTTLSSCTDYEVYVKVVAYVPDVQQGTLGLPADHRDTPMAPHRAMTAYFSRQTLAVALPTGLVAPLCLELNNPVIFGGATADLSVDWGPVASYYSPPLEPPSFTLSPWMNGTRRARKFAAGAIVPRCTIPAPPASDQKEYWAYASLGFQPVIKMTAYKTQALFSVWPAAAGVNCIPAGCPGGCVQTGSSGYWNVAPGCTLVMDGVPAPGPVYAPPASNTNVLYIDGGSGAGGGNLELRSTAIDLKNQGAIIVTGDLKMGQRRDDCGLLIPSETVPAAADLEYQVGVPSGLPAGCAAGTTCALSSWNDPTSNGLIVLRGFVYVVGDMHVVTHIAGTTGHNTAIVGVVRIDGTLTIDDGCMLNLAFDDTISRNVQTSNFELMIDSQREVPY